jgi:hypothetical protein
MLAITTSTFQVVSMIFVDSFLYFGFHLLYKKHLDKYDHQIFRCKYNIIHMQIL